MVKQIANKELRQQLATSKHFPYFNSMNDQYIDLEVSLKTK